MNNIPRSLLAHDPHRPQFHFLPTANWLNDPNGLIQWKGQYHLFYQYNPNGPFHGTIHWGHAVSDDLLHWRDLPIALAPTPGGPDAEGCWSGCALDHVGVPTILYTGSHPQVVCLATSSEDLIHWEKHPTNPVIAAPPEELGSSTQGDFRDPYVWQERGSWHMVIGSKIEGQGGVVLQYQSVDLLHWDYLGILLQGDIKDTKPFWTGTMWECPNFMRLGDRYLLFFSVQSEPTTLLYTVYFIGDYDGRQFTPSFQSKLVYGSSFYAPQAMRLEDGRVVMFGWLKEERRQSAIMESGWAGVMSLPVALAITPEGTLGIEPVEELKSLRRESWRKDNLEVNLGMDGLLGDIRGDCLEIEVVFEPDSEAEFGLRLRCSPDGEEHTRLVYQSEEKRLVLERNESSLSTVVDRDLLTAPLSPDKTGEIRLHIFLDRSVLEVFANGDTCLASRIYPARPDSSGLALFARRGSAKVKSIEIWALEPVW